jgi:phosphoglycolate phosphatase
MFDYIVFDLDGTLSDSIVGLTRSINHSLRIHGFDEMAGADLLKYIGPPLDRSFSIITGIDDEARIQSLVAVFRERYDRIGYSENRLYDGIEEALRGLYDSGIKLGVCTAKRADFAEKILNLFDIRKYFSFVSGGDVGVLKWRQLEGLLLRQTISSRSVMVGDRDVDIQSAHKNGLSSAGVLWGYGTREELSAQNPEFIFSSPSELLKLSPA